MAVHLIVEQGPDKGKQILVPADGARLGRSSKNDIVLTDPALSRHHCRLFFKPGEGLCAVDLGSYNQTLVNGKSIMETRLNVGDFIAIGDTVLKVLSDQVAGVAAASAPAAAAAPAAAPSASAMPDDAAQTGPIDLGFKRGPGPAPRRRIGLFPLVIVFAAVAALALAAWLPRVLKPKPKPKPRPNIPVQTDKTLEISYEKVHADLKNIFRYELSITRDGTIAVKIRDIAENRTIQKDDKPKDDLLKALAESVDSSGFFALNKEYRGVTDGKVVERLDLSVSVGPKTHRCLVENRPEPPAFRAVREKIELFAKNQLRLGSMQYSVEQLKEMAQAAFLNGKKLYDEREIKYGNLYRAIQELEKVQLNLESVSPKPSYYGEALTLLTDWKQDLQKRHDDLKFRTDHATKLQEWENAARELRIILELIPNREDERNQTARRELLEVEQRLAIRE